MAFDHQPRREQNVYIGVPFDTDFLVKTVTAKGTNTLLHWDGLRLDAELPEGALAHVPGGVPIPERYRNPDLEFRSHLGEAFDPNKPRDRFGKWAKGVETADEPVLGGIGVVARDQGLPVGYLTYYTRYGDESIKVHVERMKVKPTVAGASQPGCSTTCARSSRLQDQGRGLHTRPKHPGGGPRPARPQGRRAA